MTIYGDAGNVQWEHFGEDMMQRYAIAAVLLTMSTIAVGQEAVSLRRPRDQAAPPLGVAPLNAPPVRKLAPLVISPALSISYDGTQAALIPRIHAEGERYLWGNAANTNSGIMQFRLNFNPTPPTGDSVRVADNIRTLDGTFGLNVGLKASFFPAALNRETDQGSIGFDIRGGANLALQTATTLTTGSSPSLSTNAFGLGSAELTASAWLYFAYLAVQGSIHGGIGQIDPALRDALNGKGALGVSLIVPFTIAVATLDNGERKSQTLYLQLKGNTPLEDFSRFVVGVDVVVEFQPL